MIHTIIAHELCEVEYFVRIQPLLSKTISDIGNHDCVTVFQGQTGCSLNVKFLSTLITCIHHVQNFGNEIGQADIAADGFPTHASVFAHFLRSQLRHNLCRS